MSNLSSLIRRNSILISKVANINAIGQPSRSNATSITRIKKRVYPQMYKVCVINPDGSSYSVRHSEPIGVIRMPLDPSTLTDEERKARLKRLKGERNIDKSVEFEQDDVKFDNRAVTKLLRRKRNKRLKFNSALSRPDACGLTWVDTPSVGKVKTLSETRLKKQHKRKEDNTKTSIQLPSMERLRVSCREAELFDQQAVTEMSQGIYNGADYTPSVFPQWTVDENWQCYVAETAEGIVVAFLALHICDGESSVTERSARVAESHQGKGLYTLLLDYSLLSIQLKYPSITNVVRVRNLGKAIPPNYNARNQYIYNAIKCCFPPGYAISAAEQEASTQTDLAILTISNNKFSELFENNDWLRNLIPHGIFVIGDHVYHVGKLESRKHIDKQDNLVFIHSSDCESASDDERVFSVADFSSKKNLFGNEVFSLDVYGNDISMLKYHIMKVMNMAWRLANGAIFSIALNIHSKQEEELCKIINKLEHCHVYDYEEMEVMEANIKLHPYRNQLSDINNNHMIKVPN